MQRYEFEPVDHTDTCPNFEGLRTLIKSNFSTIGLSRTDGRWDLAQQARRFLLASTVKDDDSLLRKVEALLCRQSRESTSPEARELRDLSSTDTLRGDVT